MRSTESLEWTLSSPLEIALLTNARDSTIVQDAAIRRRCLLGGLAVATVLALGLVALSVPRFGGPALDARILFAVNGAAAQIPGIAGAVTILDENIAELLLAIGVVALWFAARERAPLMRRRAVLTALAFFPIYLMARALQGVVHHPRPILSMPVHPLTDVATWHQKALTFSNWGSFPSDHAALLAIVAVVAFSLDRRAGLAFSVLGIAVALFRVAAGYHWPSDVVGGALLGVVVGLVLLVTESALRPALDAILERIEAHRAFAYPVAFVVLADISQGFHYARLIPHVLFHVRLFH